MGVCVTCGNAYDKSFDITRGDVTLTFDSFECAIERLAPRCAQCGCRIIGHGLEADGVYYCCDHCAEKQGVKGLKDRL